MKKDKSDNKRNFSIRKLALFSGLIFCVCIIFIVSLFYLHPIITGARFDRDVKAIPGLKVSRYGMFEGQVFADLRIKDKGVVTIFYEWDGVPVIRHIGNFDTLFSCKNDGQYAPVMYPLKLTKGYYFSQWFPFEVTNIRQLVDRYEEIIDIIETFPKGEQSDYSFTTKGNNPVVCYVHS